MTMTNTLPAGAGDAGVAAVADGDGTMLGDAGDELCTAAVGFEQAARRMRPVTLSAARWNVEIRPERGGRITSLRLDGVELLDQGIGVDQPTADGFVEGGAFGWDEMVPTVDPTPGLPDHGEAWRVPWQQVDDTTMEGDGHVLPWRLRRTLRVDGAALRAEYELANVGDQPMPGFWCAHPLFAYEPGMVIEIAGSRLMSFAEGKSAKFFVPAGMVDHAVLRWTQRPPITFSWDSRTAPYCGVWICNGDLGGYRQVAIEPATGGGDRPDSDEPPPTLQPGESLTWWLEIRPI